MLTLAAYFKKAAEPASRPLKYAAAVGARPLPVGSGLLVGASKKDLEHEDKVVAFKSLLGAN